MCSRAVLFCGPVAVVWRVVGGGRWVPRDVLELEPNNKRRVQRFCAEHGRQRAEAVVDIDDEDTGATDGEPYSSDFDQVRPRGLSSPSPCSPPRL